MIEFVIEILAAVLGEAVVEALAPLLLALVWAAGAFCLLQAHIGGGLSGVAALLAFVCGLVLTYLWRQNSRWARNVLLIGSLAGSALVIASLVRQPPA